VGMRGRAFFLHGLLAGAFAPPSFAHRASAA
jgi:hypothetical protein